MSFVARNKTGLRIHVLKEGRPLCGGGHKAKEQLVWQEDIGPANCAACLKIEREQKNRPSMKQIEKTEDFKEMVNLLSIFSEADIRLKALECVVNEELLETIDEHKPEYAELQEALMKAETAVEVIVRRHPEWFADRKNIKTPFGTPKLHSSSKCVPVNDEATVKLLRAEEKVDPTFKADDYIRKMEVPNLEALEGMDDAKLARFMVKRVKEEKFSIQPAKVDLGKAVKEAAEASVSNDRKEVATAA